MEESTGLCPDSMRGSARSCLATTEGLLARHRYRIAGTEECRQAAHEIAANWRDGCDAVREEAFRLHPKALWYLGKAIAANYLLTSLLSLLGGCYLYAGAFLCALGFIYGLAQYVFYSELFDRAFKGAEGRNVVGTLEPVGEVRQQVILVSHHDSPYIFSFLERFQALAYLRFSLGMLAYAWLCAYSFTAGFRQLLSGEPQAMAGAAFWITAIGAPFALQLFFMMSATRSPGAGDNLNSTSMIAAIARHFRSDRSGRRSLRQTRLVLLSTDGEEIGQRGAIAYVRSHLAQLKAIGTHVLNIDSVFYRKDLTVLTRDRNFTCNLSGTMVSDIDSVARGLGIGLKRGPIPFGGGGTDAAAFAVADIEATSIVGMPTGFFGKDHLYHTSKDIVENIEVDAVEAVLELAIGYIEKVDGQTIE
jgi:aminopeptidase YwaD